MESKVTSPENAFGWTYTEFVDLPDDGTRYEILDGVLVKEGAPTEPHQAANRELLVSLLAVLRPEERQGLYFAPLAVILDDRNVFQPDLIYVRPDRHSMIDRRGILGPPDMVVEILSPSTRDRDLVPKRRAYAGFGVREYWILDLMARRVYRLNDPSSTGYDRIKPYAAGATARSEIIPAWRWDVDAVLPQAYTACPSSPRRSRHQPGHTIPS